MFRRKYRDPSGVEKFRRAWYYKYREINGQWVMRRGSPDKTLTREILAKAERRVHRLQQGFSDPWDEDLARPIKEHLAEYAEYLRAKDDSPDHVALVAARIGAVIDAKGWRTIAQINGADLAAYLQARRRPAEPAEAITDRTANFFLQAVRQWCRWLVRERRLPHSPVDHLEPLRLDPDDERRRRALSAEEFYRLLAAAVAGPRLKGLSGADRAWLYQVAAWTGFRAHELASLEPASCDLDGPAPTITVAAGYSKRRKRDSQQIRPDQAAALRAWIGGRRRGPLWPGKWWCRAAEMLRVDQAAAGIDYETEAGVADFHGLRHTYITLLATSGVHLKVVQHLARHSTMALTERYTHVENFDAASWSKALGALPAAPAASS